MPKYKVPLEAGKCYHIYNRGNAGANIFLSEANYAHFLELYAQHCGWVAETYAYCLLRNHFHLLVRVKEELPTYAVLYPGKQNAKSGETIGPAKQFSHFFNAYAQYFNRLSNRNGSLFEESFERIWVDNDLYFTRLVQYIHQNPQKHGLVADFRDYPHSSYHSHLSGRPTRLKRREVHEWFGGAKDFEQFHLHNTLDDDALAPYVIEFD
jgi:REP element-mobilizing transposase RayT